MQAAAAAEAAQAAELAAHRASAEAEAARAAAEAHAQQNRDELQAARDENSDERSRQYLILAAMAWTLLLSGVAIVLLFAKLRRSQSPPKTENPKTEDASAASMTRSSVYSRFSESIAQADAASAAKSHGYQSGGRVRCFFKRVRRTLPEIVRRCEELVMRRDEPQAYAGARRRNLPSCRAGRRQFARLAG